MTVQAHKRTQKNLRMRSFIALVKLDVQLKHAQDYQCICTIHSYYIDDCVYLYKHFSGPDIFYCA